MTVDVSGMAVDVSGMTVDVSGMTVDVSVTFTLLTTINKMSLMWKQL